MIIEMPTIKAVNVTHVRVSLPVRYGEEDIPNDAPMRSGDTWNAVIDIDTGQILDYPKGGALDLSMKVCDSGLYALLCPDGETLAEIQDYVPHCVIPGEYGDYVELNVDSEGVIQNWTSNPDVSDFFPES